MIQNLLLTINEYNPGKERKILIVLDDMISYMINNKKN